MVVVVVVFVLFWGCVFDNRNSGKAAKPLRKSCFCFLVEIAPIVLFSRAGGAFSDGAFLVKGTNQVILSPGINGIIDKFLGEWKRSFHTGRGGCGRLDVFFLV